MARQLTAKLIYPDPMKPAGLAYELPGDATVTIEIFDESGEAVHAAARQAAMKKGSQFLAFGTLGLTEGDYTVRIVASVEGHEYRMTKKISMKSRSEF